MDNNIKTIKEYIKSFPKERQEILNEIYHTIKEAAPKATEAIKYGMPTFVRNKNLVHFAMTKNHIGFYPTPSAIVHFKKELTKYATSKGTIKFKTDEKLPLTLISKIVKFRCKEDAN